MIPVDERLTPDVTYQGRPLSPGAYAASLKIMREIVEAPSPLGLSTWRATKLGPREDVDAWIALLKYGVTEEIRDGAHFRVRLTRYGQVYACQRGIT